jgi:hypothetical protein
VTRNLRRAAGYLWAAPVSLVALPLAALGAATGGRARVLGGVLEAAGGILQPILTRLVPGFAIGAITLGHVVLGASSEELEASRAHERIHVRQYERWGVLFPLMYAGSSLLALARGRRVYCDNAFERAAFEEGGGIEAA